MAGYFPVGPGAAGRISGEPEFAVLLTRDPGVGIGWKLAIEALGPLCATASSTDEVTRWHQLHPMAIAVVDLQLTFAWSLVEKIASDGVPVVGVAAIPEDRSRALDAGCFYAVSSDASPTEIARVVREQLRSKNPLTSAKGEIQLGPLVIDFTRKRAVCQDELLDLSKQLFGVLALLALRPNEPVPIGEILRFIWANNLATEDDVYHAIKRLRHKLRNHGKIVNHRGFGYVFCPADPVATIDLTDQTEPAGALAS